MNDRLKALLDKYMPHSIYFGPSDEDAENGYSGQWLLMVPDHYQKSLNDAEQLKLAETCIRCKFDREYGETG